MAVTLQGGWVDPTFALAVRGKSAGGLATSIRYLTLRGLTRPHPEWQGVFKIVGPDANEGRDRVGH